jgi:hypothetical protein
LNAPGSLPALASVVFIRVTEFARRPVAEQARLRAQLESALAVALIRIPPQIRIILDAPDGMAIAVLGNLNHSFWPEHSAVASVYSAFLVLKDVAARTVAQWRKQFKSGAYKPLADPVAFLERLQSDADAVYRIAKTAYDKARAGKGPSMIECMTYRHSGHSRADPAKYRPEGELERWKLRDPIKIYRERLLQFGVAETVITGIDTEVRKIVDDATVACKAAPNPPLELITTDVYADGGWAWRN